MLRMAVPYLLLVSLYLWEEIFQQLMLYCLAILIVTLNKRTSMQSAFCINRHYKITKRNSVFCQVALEGPPPMRKRRSMGEDVRKFVFEDGNWQTVTCIDWIGTCPWINSPLVSQILKLVPSSQSTLHQLCIFKPSFIMTNLILVI